VKTEKSLPIKPKIYRYRRYKKEEEQKFIEYEMKKSIIQLKMKHSIECITDSDDEIFATEESSDSGYEEDEEERKADAAWFQNIK